ncbi:hypothetical protein E2562_024043 [Oryza meyeriana var. granulata]|uniref:Uncharacterized protein n=1 Tax=Oryza meyeriana var. granulata TaxID=110450 RepID=A0A6G1CSE4_9ORYZ|nr:hypothetical protein E2562_024043 [Oryza meyeriana var. granulata]
MGKRKKAKSNRKGTYEVAVDGFVRTANPVVAGSTLAAHQLRPRRQCRRRWIRSGERPSSPDALAGSALIGSAPLLHPCWICLQPAPPTSSVPVSSPSYPREKKLRGSGSWDDNAKFEEFDV